MKLYVKETAVNVELHTGSGMKVLRHRVKYSSYLVMFSHLAIHCLEATTDVL